MLTLEEVKKDATLTGIEPGQVVRVVTTEPVGDNALTVYYKTSDGRLLERMLFRTDEATLALAEAGRPWAFDAAGAAFKLATEAYRIQLAYLFDPMMALHTSNVEPFPHQITAVYESMLPRQPLRYVLADDRGAGKTIMAGLFIRELLMRAAARRVLIVAPGSLVEQWQDEMFEEFGLSFTLFSREQVEQSRGGNPWRALGNAVTDVSAQRCGWDVTSIPPAREGKLPPSRHIEVKGRARGQTTITVTRNEILYGLNQADKFILAIVLVDGDRHEGPFYVKNPFTHEPDWAVTSINLDLDQLLSHAFLPGSAGVPPALGSGEDGRAPRMP